MIFKVSPNPNHSMFLWFYDTGKFLERYLTRTTLSQECLQTDVLARQKEHLWKSVFERGPSDSAACKVFLSQMSLAI